MEQLLGVSKATPKGLLRVNATLGFGRSHVAPLISRFVRKYPQVEVQLQLSVNPPPLTDDSFDVCIRFGAPPDARVIAKYIAPNRRLLCAAPAYLAKHGMPKVPNDLTQAQLHRHPPGRRGLRRVATCQRPRQERRRPKPSRPGAT
jgi:LysR family transcriptional activator of dmlA